MFRRISSKLVFKPVLKTTALDAGKELCRKLFAAPRTGSYSMIWRHQTFCTTATFENSEAVNTEAKISENDLENYIRKVDKVSWHNVEEMVSNAAGVRTGEADSEVLDHFYDKVETRFLRGEYNLLGAEGLATLGYSFGIQQRGSQEFWERLNDRFLLLMNFNKLSFEHIVRFIHGGSHLMRFDYKLWKRLEELLVEQSVVLTPSLIALLMPSMIRSTMKQSQDSLLHVHENEIEPGKSKLDVDDEGEFERIEAQRDHSNSPHAKHVQYLPLWDLVKESAVREILNMNSFELGNVCWSMAAVQNTEEGFWMSAEQKFNELRDEFEDQDYANLAYSFGVVNRGSLDFWHETEGYVLEGIDNIAIENLKLVIVGFAKAEAGSLRFWNMIQKSVIGRDLKPADLASIVYGFAQYEIISPKTWDALEAQVIKKSNSFVSNDLAKTVEAFGTAEKGSQKLWEALEERILSLDEMPRETKLLLYLTLRPFDRLTPALTTFFEDVADVGDFILLQNQGSEGEESEGEEEYENAALVPGRKRN